MAGSPVTLDGSANRAADVGRRGLLADKPVPLPEGAAISDSLEYLGRVESPGLVEGKFDRVGGRRNLITTGRFGFRTYDVSDADEPRLLDAFQPPEILGENGYWQDEDLDIDTRRKLIIGALDPRHDDVRQDLCPGIGNDLPGDPPVSKTRPEGCRSGFYVISYANPRNLRQIGDLVGLPAGHTATCIDRCNFVWTGGPARRDDLAFLGPFTAAGRGDGRPIWGDRPARSRRAEGLRQPDRPVAQRPGDGLLARRQVDEEGIAWVSGRGGIRGYATKGRHRDPFTNLVRDAHPWDPILVAGGGVSGVNHPETMFMHNSWRPTDGAVRADGVAAGNILIGTEEDFDGTCDQMGRLVLSDITGSAGGEPAVNSTPETPYRMRALDTFHPAQDTPETAVESTECSAHYFELRKSALAQAWYAQGLRVIDVSDARDVRQVGYFRVATGDAETDSLSWDVAWRGNLIYLFDMNRGIEILRLKRGAQASARMRSVAAPRLRKAAGYRAVSSLESGDLVCPLFERPA
ncbi:MAG TPA: hypothetical protein VFY87_17090 [Geminicoccaceae bacterium]|nr:hypothetical protein [Geminicoccaceae bacterium]